MPAYTIKPHQLVFTNKDSMFHVTVLDEGGGPYVGVKTDDFVQSPSEMNAIWFETEADVDAFAQQMKELLKHE